MCAKGCSKRADKLNTYDWMADLPDNADACDIVEVQFKPPRKGYFINANKLQLEKGDVVAVEAKPGHDIGTVTMTGRLVPLMQKKANLKPGTELKKVYRKARPVDMDKFNEAKSREHETMIESRQIALRLGLNMKIGDVEYQGDGNKAIFYYIADERVDFRQLIKVLADRFLWKLHPIMQWANDKADWSSSGSRTNRRHRTLWTRVVLFYMDDKFCECEHKCRAFSGSLSQSAKTCRAMCQAQVLHEL